MPDIGLEPVDGDPFAFPGTTTADTMANAADPAARADLARRLGETSWGHLFNTLTTAVPKLQSGEWDVSSPEAAERTGALGGALEVAGLGMGGGAAGPGEAVLGSGPIRRLTRPDLPVETPRYTLPRTEADIDPNLRVDLGTLHRGTEAGTTPETALRTSGGDIGAGIYATPNPNIAASYGGGPKASVSAGTRVVHSYDTQPMFPEDVAYVFGGKNVDEPVRLVSGNGIPLWEGPWKGENVESALQNHPGIRAVVGTPDSIGLNQVAIRDPSLLTPLAPIGHNMPPPGPAPAPAIGAQTPVTAPQPPIEQPPPPMPEPKPAMPEPPVTIPSPVAASATAAGEPVLNPRKIMKEPTPFAAPLGTDPHEEALTVNDILHPEWPWSLPPRSAQVEWIAEHLNDRAQDALKNLGVPGGRIDGPNPTTDELLSRSMASEAKNALERPGANAKNWYTSTFDRAMGNAALMYPEIASDENAASMFRAALAVTSQGETVPSNSVLGTKAYDYFRQNGQFPTDTTALNAKEAPAMLGNFQKMNDIINAAGGGPAGFKALREFLDMDTTPAELRAAGHPASGDELANTPVKGSYILGPKIGQGFYQNLGGNYDPVTMDLWFMRQWNRRTGTLVGNPDTSGQFDRFTQALADPNQMNDWGEQALYAGKKVPQRAAALDQLAAQIAGQHERDFKTYRPDFDAGTKVKSKLTNTAIRWLQARSGINEQPTGAAHRAWLRRVTLRARDILADNGHDVSPADLQAILWYPEKELCGKLGGRPSDEINVGYDEALANEARKRGFTDDQIQQASPLSAYRGPGRAGPANPPGAAAGGGAPVPGAPAQGQGGGQVSLEPHRGDPFAGLP